MERPALQRLLADIAASRIDIVVVYKVDRLTRALSDFARIVELFDRHNVSFIDTDLRALIGQMSLDNPLWGAPRIHGELLKLGFEVAQSTVAKYMKRHVGPPGQSWWTFLRSHIPEIAAMDLFVVPTLP